MPPGYALLRLKELIEDGKYWITVRVSISRPDGFLG